MAGFDQSDVSSSVSHYFQPLFTRLQKSLNEELNGKTIAV